MKKKTKKKVKRALPWAIAALSTTGMVAALVDRGMRLKVRELAASTVAKVHPKSNGMVNGIVPQESGAV